MLVLLLIEDDTIADIVLKELRETDVTAIRYRDPLRVLDYITELEPNALVVRQKDFPLHAQMLAALLRFYKPLRHCRMLVLGKSDPSSPSCIFMEEDAVLKDSSLILSALPGAPHASPHRGSRLVAKAQRMVRD